MTTPHEADIINKDRHERAGAMVEYLEKVGVRCTSNSYSGDSSFPVEYVLAYGKVVGSGPTFDMAVLDFIERLLALDKVVAYQSMETALQLLTGNILNMRTDLLFIKACVTKEDEA